MSHSPFPIRPATFDDASTISRVHQASREAIYRGMAPDRLVDALSAEEQLDRWQACLRDPDRSTLVGEESGDIIGFTSLRTARDQDVTHDVFAEMELLYLLPSHWRRGWGTALCDAAEALAVRRGFRNLLLWVMEGNGRARAFYAARGFSEDGAIMDTIAPELDLRAVRYRKDIA